MEELNRLVKSVRGHDAEQGREEAHMEEDRLWVRALEIIAAGAPDPAAVARIALSTRSKDNVRWYA